MPEGLPDWFPGYYFMGQYSAVWSVETYCGLAKFSKELSGYIGVPAYGDTYQQVYTVPTGKTLFIAVIQAWAEGGNFDGKIWVYIDWPDGTRDTVFVWYFSPQVLKELRVPIVVPENCTVTIHFHNYASIAHTYGFCLRGWEV